MKKQVKSYAAMIPEKCRWGMLFLLPAALVVISAFLTDTFGYGAVAFCFWVYCFLDLFLDHWIFGGICAKDGSRMDYIKSSFYGMAHAAPGKTELV